MDWQLFRGSSHATVMIRHGPVLVRCLVACALAVLVILLAPRVSLQAATASPQEQAIARLNELRAHALVDPVEANSALQQAAEAHAAYYAENGFSGHQQDPLNTGFHRRDACRPHASRRVSGKCSGESASSIGDDPVAAVDALVNSVYHRTVMLHPALTFVGFGQSAGGSVFNFGGCFEDAQDVDRLYIYPGDGQADVPTGFLPKIEQPNPLPDSAGFVGSPISVGVSPWLEESLAITNMQIVDQAGVSLSYRRVDDGSWAYFMTDLPLGAGQTFTVNITGNAAESKVDAFVRTWSFTTESAYLPYTIRLRFREGPPRLLTEYENEDFACYGQTTGHTPTLAEAVVTLPCYDIVDDSDWYDAVPFLTEFQRVGGVAALGYPLTRAITFEGRPTQFFQKGILQWRPAAQSFAYLNVFDILSEKGFDPVLAAQYLIPPPFDTSADDGLNWDQVMARHIAIMAEVPAIANHVLGTPNWLDRYGLPMSIQDYGDVVVVRAQRAAFQWWRIDTSFAKAGDVTVVNSGDIAKALGAFVR